MSQISGRNGAWRQPARTAMVIVATSKRLKFQLATSRKILEPNMEHAAHTGHSPSGETDSSPTVGSYNINFQVAGAPMAGAECELSFMVTEQRIGEPLEAFELLHDRLMHLIIVDETLSYFEHVHPAFTDGAFRITHAFPTAGRYKLWAEAKPQGAEPVLAAFRLNVGSGQAGPESRTESTPPQAIGFLLLHRVLRRANQWN